MISLIKLKIDDKEIFMEVEEEISEIGPQRVSVSESMKKAVVAYGEISNAISAYCSSLINTFKEFDRNIAPNKITAEFGIKINGEGKVFVVKCLNPCQMELVRYIMNYENCSLKSKHISPKPFEDEQLITKE